MEKIFIHYDLWYGVLTSTLCAFIIGVERELKKKPAGIRSMILIAVGCSILTWVSKEASINIAGVDPTRMIGQIITGIGFLGGGTILKNDDKIQGITTAAFVWIASSMGIMSGLGYILEPILLTIGLVTISVFLEKVEKLVSKKKEE
jgi:putative Mg2+ transporter-C (MgtC) family protein